ncbi:hypothetical protein [Qipengyuania qiaonensis]|uniref:SH3 domain-containing protein n=1 Tax=Qipengyuania qiaonensis TaxID=2867240 RepID=A0ABS7J3K9_9SPHN|nr:hypothetical protein [Qipengyuania qiaonensis]MBX7481914.1 hypothetical protein [Qipengyuania qiaonensis]
MTIRPTFFALAATIILVACSEQEPRNDANGDQAIAAPEAAGPTETSLATGESMAIDAASSPPLGKTERQASWSEDPDWSNRYSPDVTYYNRTAVALPIYSEPDKNTARVLGRHEPGSAGTIVSCAKGIDWCKLDFAGADPTGWVEMDTMTGEAS